MFANFPRFVVVIPVAQALLLCWLFYGLYQKNDRIAVCQGQFERSQPILARVTETAAQLDKQEADLTAAEARLNTKQ